MHEPPRLRRPQLATLALALALAGGCKASALATRPAQLLAASPRPTASSGPGLASSPAAPNVPTLAAVPSPVVPTLGGGGIISNNSGSLTGQLRGPASLVSDQGGGIISDQGGNVISNNGGSVISNNGAGWRLLADAVTTAQIPYANARVRLVDAANHPVLDASGKALTALSDAQGRFTFPGLTTLSDNQLLLADLPGSKGTLQAIAPKGTPPTAGLSVDLVSTLTTGYILDKYIRSQTADPIVTLDKLPAAVEADTRAKAALALDAGSEPVPATLDSAQVDATVDGLRQHDAGFDSQLETVKRLLVIGANSDAVTDGPALSSVVAPYGLVAGPDGTLYFTDGNAVRQLTTAGIVGTLAGSEQQGSQDGKGAAASFDKPEGLALDSSGNLYVADCLNNLIRKITPDGTVSTLAQIGPPGGTLDLEQWVYYGRYTQLAIDRNNNLYVGDDGTNSILEVSPAGKVTTFAGSGQLGSQDGRGTAASFNQPTGLAIDPSGNLYVADCGSNLIRKITPDGTVSTFAGSGARGIQDGKGAAAAFVEVEGLAVDANGNLYVADDGVNRLRKITPDGTVSTLAGDGTYGYKDGQGAAAAFDQPEGLAIDSSGNLYVADSGNYYIRKVSPTGVATTVAGTGQGSKAGTAASAYFAYPFAIVGDVAHNLYISDISTVYKVSPSGDSSVLAGSDKGGRQDGQGAAATFLFAAGMAIDPAGNLYVADTTNNLIRKITPGGAVTTVAGSGQQSDQDGPSATATFSSPEGLAFDSSGNMYISDVGNNCIRKLAPDGTVSTFAGSTQSGLQDGKGTAARFNQPVLLTIDSNNNLYVPDYGNNALRKITPDGTVTTLAGNGAAGDQDGQGAAATFDVPSGTAIDGSGNVYVADVGNNLIRKVTPGGLVTTLPITPVDALSGGLYVDGKSLWYTDGHQLKSFPLP